jgi:integrase
MMTDFYPPENRNATSIVRHRARIKKYRAASKADGTKLALEKNWRKFGTWCDGQGANSYPCSPELLETYLVYLADSGLKAASIDQARWAINVRHKLSGLPAPGDSEQVKVVLAGIKRTIGSRQTQKAALTIEHLRSLTFADTLAGKRDKALLLIGFAAGLRRSEISALRVEDLESLEDGYRIHILTSKTDQEGRGEFVDIVPSINPSACPVASVKDWLASSAIGSGPLFRSINRWGQLGGALSTVSIGCIVKAAAEACGMDPTKFGGHSLRAGCATYLLERGVPLNIVAKQGRWKKHDTVLRYDRNVTTRALRGVY